MKKLISALLTILMTVSVFAMLPVTVFAVDGGSAGRNTQYHFYAETGKMVFSGTGDIAYDGFAHNTYNKVKDQVKTIVFKDGITNVFYAAPFQQLPALEEITFTKVKSVKTEAFRGCPKLKTINFGELKILQDRAFADCQSLRNVTLPKTLKIIGINPFEGCSNLYTINLEKGNANYSKMNGSKAIIETANKKVKIGYATASQDKVFIPYGIRTISEGAFDFGRPIAELFFPDTLKTIEMGAFPHETSVSKIYYTSSEDQLESLLFANDLNDGLYNAIRECNYKTHWYTKTPVVERKATLKENGSRYFPCVICEHKKTETIYRPKTLKLSQTSIIYRTDGIKLTAEVTDKKGNLINSKYYQLSYPKKPAVGEHSCIINFDKGTDHTLYTGTVTRTFKVFPPSTKLKKISRGKGYIKVFWKKQNKQTEGYVIEVATKADFSNVQKFTVKGKKKTTLKLNKAKKGTRYYVRVKTYKYADNKRYLSYPSDVRTIVGK